MSSPWTTVAHGLLIDGIQPGGQLQHMQALIGKLIRQIDEVSAHLERLFTKIVTSGSG